MITARPAVSSRPVVLGSLAAVAVVLVGAGAEVSARQPDVERAVLAAADRINAAFQKRDVAAYEALTTPGFVRVGSNGRVFARAPWLTTVVGQPGPERQAGTYDQTSVRIYGSGAVVTYRNNPDGRAGVPSYLTRAERVAPLKAPPLANAPALAPVQDDVRVTMVGSELAAVTWFSGTARSLKVLARQNGVWRQVLQQSSPIVGGK